MNTKYKSIFDRTNNKNNKNITGIKDLSEIYSKMENNNPGRSLLKNLAKAHMNNNIDLNIKNNKNNNNILLESEDEEGHINKTNLFDTKSNFDLLKNTKNHNFSKTNYCFYKNVLRLEEIKIYKKKIIKIKEKIK